MPSKSMKSRWFWTDHDATTIMSFATKLTAGERTLAHAERWRRVYGNPDDYEMAPKARATIIAERAEQRKSSVAAKKAPQAPVPPPVVPKPKAEPVKPERPETDSHSGPGGFTHTYGEKPDEP